MAEHPQEKPWHATYRSKFRAHVADQQRIATTQTRIAIFYPQNLSIDQMNKMETRQKKYVLLHSVLTIGFGIAIGMNHKISNPILHLITGICALIGFAIEGFNIGFNLAKYNKKSYSIKDGMDVLMEENPLPNERLWGCFG